MRLIVLTLLMLFSLSVYSQIVYVDQNASGANDGSSWADAYTDLQAAITNIGGNTTIQVAQGTYYPTAGTERNIYFNVPRDKKLFGGFPTGGGERDPSVYPTVLSGDIGEKGVHTDNSYHVLFFDNSSTLNELDGFTIEYGYADGTGSTSEKDGGGLYVYNKSTGQHGLFVRNCIIRYNYAKGAGGGVRINKRAEIYNSQIYSNTAESGGGVAINIDGRIFNSIIANNNASAGGGGVYMSGFNSAPKVVNSIVCNNEAPDGSGIYVSSGLVCNSTIVNNKGNTTVFYGTYGTSRNTVVWSNDGLFSNRNLSDPGRYEKCAFDTEAVEGAEYIGLAMANEGADAGKNYPCFENPLTADGNLTTADALEEVLSQKWTLNPGSALIDGGDNALYPSSTTTTPVPTVDYIDRTRTINETIDVGANEALVNILNCEASEVATTSSTLSAEIAFAETSGSVERGFVYSTTEGFNVQDAQLLTYSSEGVGPYSMDLSNLDDNTTYYFRAWAKVDGVNYYGMERSLTTLDSSVPTSVEEDYIGGIKVYPNPVNELLNIQLWGEWTSVQMYDLSGQCVYQWQGTANVHKVNVEKLEEGIYLVQIRSNKETKTIKVIKQ